MENQFHIAVVQAEQQMYDCNKNVQRGLEFIKQAKEMGADLVLFPECWIQGYGMPLLYEEKTLEQLFEMEECGMTWEEMEENSAYQEWKEEALGLTDTRIQVFCERARELSTFHRDCFNLLYKGKKTS